MMAGPEISKLYVPLTCHGHSRPVTHLQFSDWVDDGDVYYLISACKDNQPMLRDGVTGDWIGTFFGHKGAIFQARLSADANIAASASADFTAKVWDTHSGEVICTLEHNHTVRAIAFPPTQTYLLATGGMENKLRIFDFGKFDPNGPDSPTNGVTEASRTIKAEQGIEIGAGIHKGTIKAIVWTRDANVLVTVADDKKIRWFDLSQQGVVLQEQAVEGEIGSCEFTTVKPEPDDIGRGLPVLCIAAGKTVYFYGGERATEMLRAIALPYDVASVALHPSQRKFVTGQLKETHAKVHDYDSEKELDVHKGHHGPIWSVAFSPDGKLYATGSEDGTIKMWKNCQGPYGLWKAERE